jgi:hypothetical protein
MRRQYSKPFRANRIWAILALVPALGLAQVPVDEQGKSFGAEIEALGEEDIPRLSAYELQELVGPVALYPDDLLAIVLPASTYPLQVIEAGRFLERLEDDPTLKPDDSWDDSVIALLNYPEVVELMNDDLDWTWRLGEAVVAQQSDVVAAVEAFRDRAYAAGNLKTDGYQTVTKESGVVSIRPAADDIIYVPYYEPTRVVVRQPRPVYYYYPQPYPVYYYPYPSHYAFNRGFFWGVTTAFTIGWATDHLSVYHHSYHGHPYFGYTYWDRWWYRRPSISVYNTTYVRNTTSRVTINRYYSGDQWRPTRNSGIVRRVTRNDYYPSDGRSRHEVRRDRVTNNTHVVPTQARNTRVVSESRSGRSDVRTAVRSQQREREPITFRARPEQTRSAPVRSVPRTSKQPANTPERRIVTRQAEPRTVTRETRQRNTIARQSAQRTVTRQAPQRSVTRQAPQRAETRQTPQRTVTRQAPQRTATRQAPQRQETRKVESRERKAPAPKRETQNSTSRSRTKHR